MRRTLSVAVVSHSPNEPSAADASLIQLLLSLGDNLLDASTAKLLLVPSCSAVLQRLTPQLAAHHQISALNAQVVLFGDALRKVSPQLATDVDRLPETIKSLMITASQAKAAAFPGGKDKPWDERLSVYDVGRYFSLYRTIHQAVAVRYATTVLDASSVLLLKPEAYLWKPVNLADLIPKVRDASVVSSPQSLVVGSCLPCVAARSASSRLHARVASQLTTACRPSPFVPR